MLWLLLIIICVIVGFLVIRQSDQRRWGRYQIERDMYFQMYPYQLDPLLPFSVVVPLGYLAQRKLQNELMLKLNQDVIYKTALVQREAARQNQTYVVQVCIHDHKVGELEPKYAEKLCLNLAQTDFFIGRPISLQAEITVFQKSETECGCRIKLNLPPDPQSADEYVIRNNKDDAKKDLVIEKNKKNNL